MLHELTSTSSASQASTSQRPSRTTLDEPDLSTRHALLQLDTDPDESDRSGDDLPAIIKETLFLPDKSPSATFGTQPRGEARFFGKSSSVLLVQEVLGLQPQPGPGNPGISFATPAIANGWVSRPWEEALQPQRRPVPQYEFPEDDLTRALIDLYFEHYHLFLPLLHRPSFETQVRDKLHHRDAGFACVLLLVCAHGSRYSDDPRVLSEESESHVWQSAGWKWFNHAHAKPKHILDPVTLYELQFYLLSAEFLHSSSLPSTGWNILGAAIRKAQDVGAHRKDTFKHKPRLVQELWRRVWWGLVVVERSASAACGRPCVSGVAESDVEPLTECDDEYWDHPDPALAWNQPEGVPANAAFYNCLIRQTDVLAHALSLLYKLKSPYAQGSKRTAPQDSALDVVLELDSQLNHWIDSIPKHLKWDARLTNPTWKRQSLMLYSNYYALQIGIHRPFITSLDKLTKFNFPSLAICTNAARACVHLIDTVDKDCHAVGHELQWPLFTATVVLILNAWAGRKAGMSPCSSQDMKDVWKSLQYYQQLEKRLVASTIIRNILLHLVSASDLPLPPDLSKGAEPAENNLFSQQPPRTRSSPEEGNFGLLLTEADLQHDQSMTNSMFGQAHPFFLHSLPVYTQELGKLSVWPQGANELGYAPPASWPTATPGNSTSDPSHGWHTQSGSRYESTSGHTSYSTSSSSGHHSNAAYSSTFEAGPTQTDSFANVFDADTLQVWTGAPIGFQMDQWGEYISNVNEIQMSNTFDQLSFGNH